MCRSTSISFFTRFFCGICLSVTILGNCDNGRVLATSSFGTFEDAPLPSKEEFIQQIKDRFQPQITEFLGYAVPVTITALFIRSSLK